MVHSESHSRLHWAQAGISGLAGSGGGIGRGAAAGAIFASAFSFLSARLCTVLQAGLAGAGGPSSAGGASGGGGSSALIARWTPVLRSILLNRKAHLWPPFRRILPARPVFRFHTHEFWDLTAKTKVCLREIGDQMGAYYWRARRSSLSFPTSASRMRTSPARALLKSFRYLWKRDEIDQEVTSTQ